MFRIHRNTQIIGIQGDIGKYTIAVARVAAQDTEVTRNAPIGTNILRMDGDAASIQAIVSGQSQAVGGNIFYIRRLEEAKHGVFEQKLTFTSIYNGACTRLDKIKASGELVKITRKVDERRAARNAGQDRWRSFTVG